MFVSVCSRVSFICLYTSCSKASFVAVSRSTTREGGMSSNAMQELYLAPTTPFSKPAAACQPLGLKEEPFSEVCMANSQIASQSAMHPERLVCTQIIGLSLNLCRGRSQLFPFPPPARRAVVLRSMKPPLCRECHSFCSRTKISRCRIISGGGDGRVRVWTVTSSHQAMTKSWKEHRGPVTCIQVRMPWIG